MAGHGARIAGGGECGGQGDTDRVASHETVFEGVDLAFGSDIWAIGLGAGVGQLDRAGEGDFEGLKSAHETPLLPSKASRL